MTLRRLALAALTALTCTAAAVPAASADTSPNWGGYVVTGRSFHSVTGTWRQPRVTCPTGAAHFAALWVGLGGDSNSSPALEQTGTEVDCSAAGRATYSAWYELFPKPPVSSSMRVRPGDVMRAAVAVSGHRVSLSLTDVTEHHGLSQTLTATAIDVSSAEWILEAPSMCAQNGSGCHTVPLANFGTASFWGAHAVTASGHAGAISSPLWSRTRIVLVANASPFSRATPSALSTGGTAFTLRYQASSSGAAARGASRITPLAGQTLVHPSMIG